MERKKMAMNEQDRLAYRDAGLGAVMFGLSMLLIDGLSVSIFGVSVLSGDIVSLIGILAIMAIGANLLAKSYTRKKE